MWLLSLVNALEPRVAGMVANRQASDTCGRAQTGLVSLMLISAEQILLSASRVALWSGAERSRAPVDWDDPALEPRGGGDGRKQAGE